MGDPGATPKTGRKFMTADEKVCLTEILQHYKDIVESKKTDSVCISQKKKAWINIAKEFNSIPENSTRTLNQLHKAWDNIKSRRRKEISEEKKQRMATGGGVYKPTRIEDDVDGIVNSVDIELQNSIDSDALALAQEDYILNEDNVLEPIQQDDEVVNIADFSPKEISTSFGRDKELGQPKEPDSVKGKEFIRKRTYNSRGTEIERELESRLNRNKILLAQDAEIHALRIEEHKLRIEEQRLRVEEQAMKNKIVEMQLKKAMQIDEENK